MENLGLQLPLKTNFLKISKTSRQYNMFDSVREISKGAKINNTTA